MSSKKHTHKQQERDIKKVVWPENRDQVFLQWLVEDITALQKAGFSIKGIKKMLGSLDYVKIWAANPSWLFPITGLPKGFRWRDGQKFVQKRTRRSDGHTYVFLPVAEDLYIKGIHAAGTCKSDYYGAKIKQYQKLAGYEVTAQLAMHRQSYDPFFESSIHTFWHSQGLRLFADPGSSCPLYGKLVKQQSLDEGD